MNVGELIDKGFSNILLKISNKKVFEISIIFYSILSIPCLIIFFITGYWKLFKNPTAYIVSPYLALVLIITNIVLIKLSNNNLNKPININLIKEKLFNLKAFFCLIPAFCLLLICFLVEGNVKNYYNTGSSSSNYTNTTTDSYKPPTSNIYDTNSEAYKLALLDNGYLSENKESQDYQKYLKFQFLLNNVEMKFKKDPTIKATTGDMLVHTQNKFKQKGYNKSLLEILESVNTIGTQEASLITLPEYFSSVIVMTGK